MLELAHDLRSSIRGLLRRPAYPIVAVGILTLGLSAAMAVVTYVNAFYQPFPGVEDDRLVRVFGTGDDDTYQNLSYLDFLDYRASDAGALEDSAFEGLAATQPYYMASVRLETRTGVASLEAVSGGYFSVLGIRPTIGRGLTPDDDRPEADPVAVISHEWWQRGFGGDQSVLGRTIFLNYRPFTVVGVAPPAFLGVTSGFRPNVWIPFAPFSDRYTSWAARSEDRDFPLVWVYGRLRAGVRQQQGLAALAATASGLDEAHPRHSGARHLRLDPATWIDPRSRLEEWSTVQVMTMAAAGLLLLVCANVANLLLAVALRRRRETAVRAALGASPGRLARQVMLDNVLLSSLAGGIALLLAGPLSHRLGAYFARPSVWGVDVARQTSVDLSVAGAALLVSIVTGVAAGLLPATRVWRRDLVATLRSAGASSGVPRRVWDRRIPGVRDLLVSAQVALAVVLLVVAGLVFRTLHTAGRIDPGFSHEPFVATLISTSSTDLEASERDVFQRQLAARLAEEPWVRSVAMADAPLLGPHREVELLPAGEDEPVSLVHSKVIPGFFDALGIEVIRGRSFAETDTAEGRDVAVINEELARRYFAGENPLGRQLGWPEMERTFEIVGVVADTRTEDLFAEPPPTVFFAYPQHDYGTTSAMMVSVNGEPLHLIPRLHRWLRDYEPYLAIINIVTYKDVVRGFLYTQRMNAEMFSTVAFFGLALSVVGIWSVVSLAVGRRTREIAVRMAVGAERFDISRLFVSRALVPVTLGLALGLTLSYALAGLVRGLLFGVEPTDPGTLLAGAGVLVVSALSAAYLPARRAAAVDPAVFLRQE